MNRYLISVYSKQDSKIKLFIEENIENLKDFDFVFYEISRTLPPEKALKSLIIIEETAFDRIFNKFAEMIESYKYKPMFIVFSENPDIPSVVRWMKLGADNYIDITKKLKLEMLKTILNQSLFFDNFVSDKAISERKPFDYPPFSLSKEKDWSKLENGKKCKMSLLIISILWDNKQHKINKNHIDNILLKLNGDFKKMINTMGGKNLFWNGNDGLFLFYFGDRKNCAVASAISILNKMQIFSMEQLHLLENINIKISIHDGDIIYNNNDTRFITSDTLNSVMHLQKRNKDINCLDITENIFESLNPRLKRFFYKQGSYEGRVIYTYYYNI